MADLTFAYYCSGHGYGHATRVSAFVCHLLSLPETDRPSVVIVSSAPERVFADSIAQGASYRYAVIDPVIVQPVAYRVDRQKSVDVLKAFLARKDELLNTERNWLQRINAKCVISDAAFLGCWAAKAAGIPSILMTNFTFDSVYSYLSTTFSQTTSRKPEDHDCDHLQPAATHRFEDLVPDLPITSTILDPLVEVIHAGYRCADLLLLLPGNIPIPSFPQVPALPSPGWVEPSLNRFHPSIIDHLTSRKDTLIHPSIPFPPSSNMSKKYIPRTIRRTPLIVRSPHFPSSVYTKNGRSQFLTSIGIPDIFHNPSETKILIVSFGGQVFKPPSRSGSRTPSRANSHDTSPVSTPQSLSPVSAPPKLESIRIPHNGTDMHDILESPPALSPPDTHMHPTLHIDCPPVQLQRIATPSHIWIPGAPPASKPPLPTPITMTPSNSTVTVTTIPPSPNFTSDKSYFADPVKVEDPDPEHLANSEEEANGPVLLPDQSWIAIVCGVSKEQWREQLEADGDTELPDGFFVAPRDVYMPDLTAAGDVLLGKLGYGTVSECVDSCTPFVYVSRPLFIEEHGLRLLLEQEGVGIELSREQYEAGDWARSVQEAWVKGRDRKALKRQQHERDQGLEVRGREGRELAGDVVQWVRECWA